MRKAVAILAVVAVPLAGAGSAQESGPTWIDVNQTTALQSSAWLTCRQIHLDHEAGRSPDDCVIIGPGIMEARAAERSEYWVWDHHLANVWCEGNRYMAGGSHRFQIRRGDSCQQVCELPTPDESCVTKMDLGRAARRKPNAWPGLGEFQLVERPRERAPRCSGDDVQAEVWRVIVVATEVAPGARWGALLPDFGDQPTLFHVICPDGVEVAEGARFRARVARGDTCLPWSSPGGEPCLTGIEPIAEPTQP